MHPCHDACATHLYHVLHVDLVAKRVCDHSQGDWDGHMRYRNPREFIDVPTADLPCHVDLPTVLAHCEAQNLFGPHDPRWQEFGWTTFSFPRRTSA